MKHEQNDTGPHHHRVGIIGERNVRGNSWVRLGLCQFQKKWFKKTVGLWKRNYLKDIRRRCKKGNKGLEGEK